VGQCAFVWSEPPTYPAAHVPPRRIKGLRPSATPFERSIQRTIESDCRARANSRPHSAQLPKGRARRHRGSCAARARSEHTGARLSDACAAEAKTRERRSSAPSRTSSLCRRCEIVTNCRTVQPTETCRQCHDRQSFHWPFAQVCAQVRVLKDRTRLTQTRKH
jgi:hypothetical protein